MSVTMTRVKKIGASRYLLLPANVLDLLAWNHADPIALRITGLKVIAERVPVEDLARLKFATAEGER